MKIIVDSGSTKADWIVFNNEQHVYTLHSLGLNPEVISSEELHQRIISNEKITEIAPNIEKIFFYGSGCGTPRSKKNITDILKKIFFNASLLDVKEDTYAAVFSVIKEGEKGIVSINGTGSNVSYYDGNVVHQNFYSLGYILMDDFSGSDFGKRILKDYFLKIMPSELRLKLEKKYNLEADEVKFNIFKKENPNAYLASFLPFLIENKETPYFATLIREKIQYFLDNYIKLYDNYQSIPLHFVGSVAFLLQEELKEILQKNGCIVGKIIQKPIEGLIQNHKQ